MITNSHPSAWLKACADLESEGSRSESKYGTPGAVIAEFSDMRDAALFRGLKGPNQHCVTAGISFPFAVRRLV